MSRLPYLKGDRVRLTWLGRRKGSKTYKGQSIKGRLGTVQSTPRAGTQAVKVQWDNRRTAAYVHFSFIKAVVPVDAISDGEVT